MSDQPNRPNFSWQFDSPYEQGDLVQVDGYGANIYRIEAYGVDLYFTNDTTIDIYYDLDGLSSGPIEACYEDIKLVAKAAEADAYLKENPPAAPEHPLMYIDPDFAKELYDVMFPPNAALIKNGGANEMKNDKKNEKVEALKPARPKTPNERMAAMDLLLDEYNDIDLLIELYGDKDGEYAARKKEIEKELNELPTLAEVKRK